MNSFNPLDRHFQSKLGNMSVQPRADMWNKIQDQLAEEKEEKVAFWFSRPFLLGAGLIVVGSLLAFVFWINLDQKNDFALIKSSDATKVVASGIEEATLPQTLRSNSEVVSVNIAVRELAGNLGAPRTVMTDAPLSLITKKTPSTLRPNLQTAIAQSIISEQRQEELKNTKATESTSTSIQDQATASSPTAMPIDNSLSNASSKIPGRTELLPTLLADLPISNLLPSLLLLPKKANTKKFRSGRDGFCYGDDSPDHHFTTELYFNVGGTLKHLSSKIGNEQAYIQKRQDSETSLVNLGFGGRISYVFKRDFVFKAGVDYYQLNEKFVNKNSSTRIIILIDTIQTDMGPKVVTSTYQENGFTVNRYQNKYKMIDLPFSVGYQFRQKNYLLQVNGGASVNLTFIQEGKIVNNFGTPVSIDRFDPDNSNIFKTNLGLSLFGSVQLQVPLSKTNYFFVEPTVRYTLNDVTRPNYQLKQKLTMIGSQIGIGFKL